MFDETIASFEGLPTFFSYFLSALILAALFVALYVHTTPYKELKLIRDGNHAAAIHLSGALIGFAIPLGSAVAFSVGLIDLLIWGGIALLAQIAAYQAMRLIFPRLQDDITQDHTASALFVAGVSVTVGILNAASMTY